MLRVYIENEGPAFGGTFVDATNSQWDERSITWINAPYYDVKVLDLLMEVKQGSWYNLDVNSSLHQGGAWRLAVLALCENY